MDSNCVSNNDNKKKLSYQYDFVGALCIQLYTSARTRTGIVYEGSGSARIRSKSVEKAEREWAAVMNEWLKRLIYGPGLNALALPRRVLIRRVNGETK